jgi:hypothetical protein
MDQLLTCLQWANDMLLLGSRGRAVLRPERCVAAEIQRGVRCCWELAPREEVAVVIRRKVRSRRVI